MIPCGWFGIGGIKILNGCDHEKEKIENEYVFLSIKHSTLLLVKNRCNRVLVEHICSGI